MLHDPDLECKQPCKLTPAAELKPVDPKDEGAPRLVSEIQRRGDQPPPPNPTSVVLGRER